MNDYEMVVSTIIVLIVLNTIFFLKYYWVKRRNEELQEKVLTLQKEILELVKIEGRMIRREGELQSSIDRLLQSSTYYETEFKNLFEYMKAIAMMTTERNDDRKALIMHKRTAVTRSMIEDGVVKIGTKTVFTLPAIQFTEEAVVIEDNEEDTKKEGMS